jgi:hypothetical protein
VKIEDIKPRDLASFEEMVDDEKIAAMHQHHYNKKRVKNLLKVAVKLMEIPLDKRGAELDQYSP